MAFSQALNAEMVGVITESTSEKLQQILIAI